VVLAALAGLNVRGVRGASRFNGAMTVAKLLPLALFVVLGVAAVQGPNLAIASAPATADVARASAFLLFAFLGRRGGAGAERRGPRAGAHRCRVRCSWPC
jgi:amino acid transporter